MMPLLCYHTAYAYICRMKGDCMSILLLALVAVSLLLALAVVHRRKFYVALWLLIATFHAAFGHDPFDRGE